MHTGSENTPATSENGSPINAAGALHLYRLLTHRKSREVKDEANVKICEFVVSLNSWLALRGKLSARLQALTLICLGILTGVGSS